MKTILGIRIESELKKLLQKLADDDNRSLSNFVNQAILTYVKEHKGIDWKKTKK